MCSSELHDPRKGRPDGSLPSRGAWIEIWIKIRIRQFLPMSLPSRGAWIEIDIDIFPDVDEDCRSPHGERGLKFLLLWRIFKKLLSLPSRGAWIEI